MKIVPKGSKLIYAILFLLKPSWFLVFSFDSHLNTSHFSGNVHVGVASMIYFLKNMFTLNMLHVRAFYRRALSVGISVYILLFSIKLQFIPVFFCKLRHGIFFFFFFFFFTKCTVLNGDVANNYVLGL